MFKFEWPLIVPDNEDVKAPSAATRYTREYIVQIADKNGLQTVCKLRRWYVQVHLVCHHAPKIGRISRPIASHS